MSYKWKAGFPAPKGVDVEDFVAVLEQLPEPSPKNLYEASKDVEHLMHEDLWSESDAIWAERGRVDRCRHCIAAVWQYEIDRPEDGHRCYEWIELPTGVCEWARTEDIVSDEQKLLALLKAVTGLQRQMLAKLETITRLVARKS